MSAENEALVRRFFEEFCNQGRGELAEEFVTLDYVSHGPQAPPADGITDGKIAEEWTVWDALGLLQQVGAVPAAA